MSVVAGILLLMAACAGPAPRASEGVRAGEFEFTPPGGGPSQKVFYATAGERSKARIVIVLHGVKRNASEYRDNWVPLIEGKDAIVVAPEFDDVGFPGVESYNLGGMTWSDGEARPRGQWAFGRIEALFDDVVARLGGGQREYALFGHSAGAQFVHRFVAFVPEARVSTAVAANAGWYTTWDGRRSFPYGLKGAPAGADAATALGRDVLVLLGADDVETENLRMDAEAMRQGATRLDRGVNFYLGARQYAADEGVQFSWRLQVVPGAAHDNLVMAQAAAPVLLG